MLIECMIGCVKGVEGKAKLQIPETSGTGLGGSKAQARET